MPQYFASLIPGGEEIAAAILHQRLAPQLTILAQSPGAMEFETPVPYQNLNLFCFNNIFLILAASPAQPDRAGLEGFLRALPENPHCRWDQAAPSGKARTFRVVTACQNQHTAVDPKARQALEKKIARETGLRVDRSLPDAEFWVTVRRDGRACFLKRLSRHRAYDKLLHPGELHPQLAYMMCWLTSPSHKDIVVDPFCGYGAIPLQRALRFPFRQLFAFDSDPRPLALARKKLPRRENLVVARRDALNLTEALPEWEVDAIITDPPWGLYEDLGMELSLFYRRMLDSFGRVIRPGGRAVVLTAGKRELEEAVSGSGFVLSERYDILVSGKKCGLFLLRAGE